ncbi:MAG TPA: hypothetical protein VFT88_11960 [Acidobacteriaceae bacterium]|jgi:hypothetical protein|nr:hypothetical protein [Acidobacteriaceae bacterium]
MDVHLDNPNLEAKISQWVTETGHSADELVENALTGYLSELAEVRETLDSRYDDIESGRVKLIDGEEALARIRQKIESRRLS